MRASSRSISRGLVPVAVCLLSVTTGCGPIATVAWLIHGPEMTEVEFDGLKGKRVAVVCLDANSLSGPGGEADTVAKAVAMTLGKNVSDIKIVRQTEVADWLDSHGDDVTDYRDVGRGVKADMVVGIDLLNFNLHEGQTLLKGRAKIGVKVYDMKKGGELVYESAPKEIAWPENGARHVTENEANFRTIFIGVLAERIANDFYPVELSNGFGTDARFLAN
ncbi:MAG TPA: hypothetical protein VGI40_08190 [Pirellulaceae bacterium]